MIALVDYLDLLLQPREASPPSQNAEQMTVPSIN